MHRFTQLIKVERQKRGLTATQIAEECGLSKATYLSIENHKTARPHILSFFKLGKILEIDPSELLRVYYE